MRVSVRGEAGLLRACHCGSREVRLPARRCPPQPRVGRGRGHSPLMLHDEPDGVADVSVLLVGAELHLHAHVLLLALNVL